MTPRRQPKLRFSDVVYAIDSTPKALRNWIQRGQVTLFSEPGGWRKFILADVAVLALVRKFVDFGIKVETANLMAHEALAALPEFVAEAPELLPAVIDNRIGIFIPEGDGERLLIADNIRSVEKQLRSSSFAVIGISALVNRAFSRALKSLNEGIEEDADK